MTTALECKVRASSALHRPSTGTPASAYLASLAPGSRRSMVRALRTLAELATDGAVTDADAFPWASLEPQHADALRAALAERFAPATANRHLSALRGTLKAAWRLGLIDAETYKRTADVPNVTGQRLPSGRALSLAERRALYGACDDSPSGRRDAAIVALLDGAGLRRSEASHITLDDLDPSDGVLRVRIGKGRKQRQTYLDDGALAAVQSWLAVRGLEPGSLLCPVGKGGSITIRPMSDQAIYHRLQRIGERAGVEFSPHDLRRTFCSDVIDATGDLRAAQELLGHASPNTTARYDRRGERVKRRAVGMRAPATDAA